MLSSQSQASLLPPLKQPIVPESYFEKSQQLLNQALKRQRKKSEATREVLKSRDLKVREPPVVATNKEVIAKDLFKLLVTDAKDKKEEDVSLDLHH